MALWVINTDAFSNDGCCKHARKHCNNRRVGDSRVSACAGLPASVEGQHMPEQIHSTWANRQDEMPEG